MSHGADVGTPIRTGPFHEMIRSTAMGLAAVAIAIVLPAAPSSAADSFAFVSAAGSGTTCTAAQPCDNIAKGYTAAVNGGGAVARVICAPPVPAPPVSSIVVNDDVSFEINCPQGYASSFQIQGANTFATLRGLTFPASVFASPIIHTGSDASALIIEDCTFVDGAGSSLDIEPTGPLTLVIRRSRISNNIGGILLKPGAGGSIKATFDHVVITGNHGGGIRVDTTNGPVTVDVTDSVISNNAGTGINTLGNSGGQAIVSVNNSVIAKNGGAGVQANGANAGVLLGTTLLDQNTVGATSVVSGGNMFTYGNNQIVGPIGSGFTSTATLH